jgi:prolipoprotein diacylglyceryl transferase
MRVVTDLSVVWASIPSPGEWGRQYRLYGIMIALGVIAGLELARRRWAARGGNPEDMSSIALWAVPAGLIGARLYHVITDNELYRGEHWVDAFKIWQGGLGIPGGILAGVAVGVWAGRRKGIRLPPALDTVAPALALAQAIGRWGNYFNVELFGSPTSLPWGLDVPLAKRPLGYEQDVTFHPTFLYESLWNVGLVLVLIWVDSKRVLRPGRIFALYIGGYFTGRLWVESLRIDEANKILGLRVNTWTSLLAIGGVLLFFAVAGLRRRPGDSDEPYVDGHRWDPELAVVPAAGDATPEADADAVDEAEDPAPVASGGTRARAARQGRDPATATDDRPQRASGGGDDADRDDS